MLRVMRVTGVVTAVVAGVLALALLTACAGDEREPQAPASIDASYAFDDDLTCESQVRMAPSLSLSEEPIAALICADPGSSMPWTSPADLLERGMPRLRAALDGLEPAPEAPYDCTFQGGPAFDLMMLYPDGRAARVHGDLGGCSVVDTAEQEWFGAVEVFDVVLEEIEQQRKSSSPPASVPGIDLACDRFLTESPPLSLTGDADDLVSLISCWQPNAPELGPWNEAAVRKRDVGVVTGDIPRHASPTGDSNDLRCVGGLKHHYFQHLIGETVWGDVVMLSGECRRFAIVDYRPEGPFPVWHPSPEAQRILDGLRR